MVWVKGMKCRAAKQALADAERERDNALLREVKAGANAQFIVQHSDRMFFDWAAVRTALRDVRRWEALCDGAEVALTSCIDNARRRAALERLLEDEYAMVKTLRSRLTQDLAHYKSLTQAYAGQADTVSVRMGLLTEIRAVEDDLCAHYLRSCEIRRELATNDN